MTDETPEMSFEEQLDQDIDAQAELEPDHAITSVLINGKIRKLKFIQMDGLAWSDLCDRCPPRVGVELDTAFGYNVTAAIVLAAPLSGSVQSGENWVELAPDRWKKLIRSLPGAQLRAVGDAIFQLNQFGPAMAVLDAKKASQVESVMKSFSPALSESPEAV